MAAAVDGVAGNARWLKVIKNAFVPSAMCVAAHGLKYKQGILL